MSIFVIIILVLAFILLAFVLWCCVRVGSYPVPTPQLKESEKE